MMFVSPDTLIPDSYNPLDWNRYLYAHANPVRYSDPSGHMVDDGCRTEVCSASQGEEYRDYVYNVIHNNNERQENTKKVESAVKVLEFGGSVVSEPVDWAITAKDCLGGECSPLALLGLLPFIPGSKVDDIVDVVKGLDGVKLPVDDTLDLATEFLGKDYIDMGKGRFLSADNLRQVRMGMEDILGTHPFSGGPHINFELLGPKPGNPGHFQIIQDIHIFIYEVFK